MFPSICREMSKCFGIVFKGFHNWAILHPSSSFTSDFPPVTTFAGHTQMCYIGKYTWAHKVSTFSFPLCKLTLSSCPSSDLPPLNLDPSLPRASTQLEGVSCLFQASPNFRCQAIPRAPIALPVLITNLPSPLISLVLFHM